MKKKLLFFYLRTWGWHISNAKALKSYFDDKMWDEVDIKLQDGLEKSKNLFKKIIEDWYAKLQSKWRLFYNFLYFFNKNSFFAKINQILMSKAIKNQIEEYILDNNPDCIVIFHFFLIKPVTKIISDLWKKTKIITIVTDPFTVPKLRFLEKNMTYIVYSSKAQEIAIKNWIDKKNIFVFSPIVDPKYEKKPSKEYLQKLKKKYWIKSDKKNILIFGGGDGMKNTEKIIEKFLEKKINTKLFVICGKDKTLKENIEKIISEKNIKNIQVFGFIDFVYDLICVADLVVTKAWPASIMEIIHLGKIPVINNYIWEQEKWNVEFVVKNQIWIYEKNIEKMIFKIQNILKNSDFYEKNIKKLKIENWAKNIAKFIIKNI